MTNPDVLTKIDFWNAKPYFLVLINYLMNNCRSCPRGTVPQILILFFLSTQRILARIFYHKKCNVDNHEAHKSHLACSWYFSTITRQHSDLAISLPFQVLNINNPAQIELHPITLPRMLNSKAHMYTIFFKSRSFCM
jgi:hypothetical protein